MYSKLIEALLSCLDSLFDYKKAVSDNATTSEVLDDKNKLEKACQYAEIAIELVEKRATFLRNRDKKKFDILAKKFRKFK